MDKYEVLLSPKAYRDLEGIYQYIKSELLVPETALKLVSLIEKQILDLELFLYRGSVREIGIYADKGYRQVFVKNYTIVYRVEEEKKQVMIITVRYSPSNF